MLKSSRSVIADARNMVGIPPSWHAGGAALAGSIGYGGAQSRLTALPELKQLPQAQPSQAGAGSWRPWQAAESSRAATEEDDDEGGEACHRKMVAKELERLSVLLGAAPGAQLADGHTSWRLVAEQLRALCEHQRGGGHGPQVPETTFGGDNRKQQLDVLERENAKCKRYIQRQRAYIEKLQSERKRYAEQKAAVEFTLAEVLAGRGQEAAALLQGVAKNSAPANARADSCILDASAASQQEDVALAAELVAAKAELAALRTAQTGRNAELAALQARKAAQQYRTPSGCGWRGSCGGTTRGHAAAARYDADIRVDGGGRTAKECSHDRPQQ
eukprot:SAG22_NODE_254_length_13588_cov_10.695678_8_plen_331_part_00